MKSYLVKTLTGLKYRIDCLELVTQRIHLNIEKLLDYNNSLFTGQHSAIQSNDDSVTDYMDSFFPIKSEEELLAFETAISDLHIRRILVNIYFYFNFYHKKIS